MSKTYNGMYTYTSNDMNGIFILHTIKIVEQILEYKSYSTYTHVEKWYNNSIFTNSSIKIDTLINLDCDAFITISRFIDEKRNYMIVAHKQSDKNE